MKQQSPKTIEWQQFLQHDYKGKNCQANIPTHIRQCMEHPTNKKKVKQNWNICGTQHLYEYFTSINPSLEIEQYRCL